MTEKTAPSSTDETVMQQDVNPGDILKIIEKHITDRGGIIAILEEIQTSYGYLPEKALRIVSDKTKRSLVDIYGIATFYRLFSLKPRGKHLVCACLVSHISLRKFSGSQITEPFRKIPQTLNLGNIMPDFTQKTRNS